MKFWHQQPVRLHDSTRQGPGDVATPARDLRHAAPLPAGLCWTTLRVEQAQDLQELAQLLACHYAEPDASTEPAEPADPSLPVEADVAARFAGTARLAGMAGVADPAGVAETAGVADPSDADLPVVVATPEVLRWLLSAPGTDPSWGVGLRQESGSLVGSILGLRLDLELADEVRPAVLVTFLCLQPALRQQGLAPMLIQELTRRVNLCGIESALFTTRLPLPLEPLAVCRYACLPLGCAQSLGRLGLEPWQIEAVLAGRRRAEDQAMKTRPLRAPDLPVVAELLQQELQRRVLRPHLDQTALGHWLLGSEGVYAYAIEESSKVRAFFSFYCLTGLRNHSEREQSIIQRPSEHSAFAFYSASGDLLPEVFWSTFAVTSSRAGLSQLFALDSALDRTTRLDLGFQPTDGFMSYHLFNWFSSRAMIEPQEIGVPPL